jgi:tRNA threonylcarbamoyladenosine biosynthesis protein TsaB
VRILGFDTATRATTVALWDSAVPERAIEARDDPPPGRRPGHATRLLALIADVLGAAASDWSEIDRIAVGVGPGTFTGLRIGIATANGLARARGIPLVGVSTLRALASNAAGEPERDARELDAPGLVIAVLDARRREVFAAGWRRAEIGPSHDPVLAPRAIAPDELAELIVDLHAGALAIGDGAVEFRSILERSGALVPDDDSELHRVRAVNHCRLAGSAPASAPVQIRPEYLRLPDAELARRTADRT